jgi:phage terminase large subunit-like protein
VSEVRDLLLSLPHAEREKVLAALSHAQLQELIHDWRIWARPNQLPPPGPWTFWLMCAGRGFGKTRSAAEWVQLKVREAISTKTKIRVHLIGATSNDVWNTMLHGESGLCRIGPPELRPLVNSNRMTLSWGDFVEGQYFSSDAPERLRGPQCHIAWLDEIAAFAASASAEQGKARDNQRSTWENFLYGFRLGEAPQAVITTTPRPQAFLRALLKLPGVVVTRGSSYDNRANLAPAFFDTVISPYEGTRLGRQEIDGELLEDLTGSLFRPAWFRNAEVKFDPAQNAWIAQDRNVALTRIIVAIDPAVSSHERSNETGIIVAGKGADGCGYILADKSGVFTPDEWARIAVAAYDEFHADRIVAEVNQGGALVEAALRTVRPHISYRAVHASRGKIARAEPVSALYEQGRVFHRALPSDESQPAGERRPSMPRLEAQMTLYQAGDPSPDRLDALVWALTHLLLTDQPSARGVGQERLGWF